MKYRAAERRGILRRFDTYERINRKEMIFSIFAVIIVSSLAVDANAQIMTGRPFDATDWQELAEHTLREENEGKELWEKFQAKEIGCADLADEQFGVLGEYFMGHMTGDSHAAANAMMMQMHGKDGEEQIHTVLGKRLSGCDTSAAKRRLAGRGGWFRSEISDTMSSSGVV